MSVDRYDVVVAGAGIIGLNIAWQIARRSSLSVAVLDKGYGVGEGSTGASSAICRYRYSIDEMLHLAASGISCYQDWRDYTRLSKPAASFQQVGTLWMPGEDREWAQREQNRLKRAGIPAVVIDDDELAERFPAISPCVMAPDFDSGEAHDCCGGGLHLLELKAGYIDPILAAQDLVEACRANNVSVLFRSKIVSVGKEGSRISSLTLANGDRIEAAALVCAAGPWCRDLYKAVDLEMSWNLVPTRIQVLYRDRPPELHGEIPITVDMQGGIYFRTQNRGQQILVSSVSEEDEREAVDDPDCFERDADEDFRLYKLHALHHRLPGLEQRGKVLGFSGLYTMNRDDVHPVLGRTEVDGFWVANGFSGHGFKLAPAIGAMMANELTGIRLDGDPTVPISFFSIDREPFELATKSVLA